MIIGSMCAISDFLLVNEKTVEWCERTLIIIYYNITMVTAVTKTVLLNLMGWKYLATLLIENNERSFQQNRQGRLD